LTTAKTPIERQKQPDDAAIRMSAKQLSIYAAGQMGQQQPEPTPYYSTLNQLNNRC
jgi:hypothetical protein